MSTPTRGMTSTNPFATGAFWERLWRLSGIISVVLFAITYFFYGYQPPVGASADELAAFYEGNRTGILLAAVFAGNAILFLMWFAAALKVSLAEAGQDGWGAAAISSSAAAGALFLLRVTIGAAIAYSGNAALASGLNDFSWACLVLSSFPRAMLIMSGTFGFWRAGLISNALFAAGVAAVVLVFLGGTTWLSAGFWAPDGAYSRFVTVIVGVVWVLVWSRILLARVPAARAGW